MYPHLLRKAEKRFARAGITEKPKPVYEPTPPPFVLGDGADGSSPAKEFGQTKGKVAIPTGADGGKLNIYSHNEFEKAKAHATSAAPPKPVKSLAGGGGRAHVHQPSRPTPFGLGGAYNMPEMEMSQYDHSNSLYHPGMKFAAPAGKVVQTAAPETGVYKTAYEFNQERKKGILTMAHPLVKGNGDILGHDGKALYNKHMVDVKKVGDDAIEEKRYRRNMRRTEAVKKWGRKKQDGHHMKNILSQEHVGGARDNPSQYLFGGAGGGH